MVTVVPAIPRRRSCRAGRWRRPTSSVKSRRRRGAAVVVDDVLDHRQRRRLVVVGDRAGLGLPPLATVPEHSADVDSGVPAGPVSVTVVGAGVERHRRARRLGAGERGGSGLVAVTFIVKSPAAVPPLSLMTCLITISVAGQVVVGDGAGLASAPIGDGARCSQPSNGLRCNPTARSR